jgi:hypothetical protein
VGRDSSDPHRERTPSPRRGAPAHRRPRRTLPLAAALLLATLLLALPAAAERNQKGNLIVAVEGNISPLQLPRHHPAPVSLQLGGRIATADGSPLPRMKRIRLVIAGRGVLSTAGLPVCPRARLRNASRALALRRCHGALVGRGRLEADAFIANQKPFAIHATLLAFNGRAHGGGPAVWVHAFSANPPLAIILPFIVRRDGRRLQTSLTATVPAALGNLPHLASFELNLFRRYRHRGELRSYLSASCPVPASFTAGFLAFAKAAYRFADGRTLRTEAVRSCRAR